MSRVFQIGAEVEETRSTIVTVRVRAKNLQDARKKVRDAVIEKVGTCRGGESLVYGPYRTWETSYFEFVTISDEEWPEKDYSADLDLAPDDDGEEIEDEPELNPNQLELVGLQG